MQGSALLDVAVVLGDDVGAAWRRRGRGEAGAPAADERGEQLAPTRRLVVPVRPMPRASDSTVLHEIRRQFTE